MLNSFRATSADPDVLLRTFASVLDGQQPSIIIETAKRYSSGDVDGASDQYAPTPAEFAKEVRRRAALKEDIAKSRPRLPSPHTGAPWHIRQEKARTKYRDCPIIKENVSYDEFRRMSAAREVPVGGAWVAAVATVYGPPAGDIAARS
jgi:hypothetical protein